MNKGFFFFFLHFIESHRERVDPSCDFLPKDPNVLFCDIFWATQCQRRADEFVPWHKQKSNLANFLADSFDAESLIIWLVHQVEQDCDKKYWNRSSRIVVSVFVSLFCFILFLVTYVVSNAVSGGDSCLCLRHWSCIFYTVRECVRKT